MTPINRKRLAQLLDVEARVNQTMILEGAAPNRPLLDSVCGLCAAVEEDPHIKSVTVHLWLAAIKEKMDTYDPAQ